MRIAFASAGSGGLDDTISSVFGRAPTFTIVDIENGEIKDVKTLENPASKLPGGAGIQAAQFIVEQGVTHVVAGNFGPNASMVLSQMGIEMIIMSSMKIKDAIEKIKSGDYQRFEAQEALGAPIMGPGGYGRWGRGEGFFQAWPWKRPWTWTPPWMEPIEPGIPIRDIEIQYLEFQKRMIEGQIRFLNSVLRDINERLKKLKGS